MAVRVAVVSSVDPEDDHITVKGVRCPECAISLIKYCRRQGYGLAWRSTAGLTSRYFVKMYALREMLFDHGWDAVLWVDNDAFISNTTLMVQDFLAGSVLKPYHKSFAEEQCCRPIGDTNSLILQSTDYFPNSGVMIMRRTEWARGLLDDILRVQASFTAHPADQDALHNGLNNLLGLERDECVRLGLKESKCWQELASKRPLDNQYSRIFDTAAAGYAGHYQARFFTKEYLKKEKMEKHPTDLVAQQFLGFWTGYKVAKTTFKSGEVENKQGCLYK